MPAESLPQIEGLDSIDQIMTEAEVDRADAEYIAGVLVKCPMKGPNGEVREMTFGELMTTEHGQEHGVETLLLARRKLEAGVDLQEAMSDALGSQAIRDRETGELMTADERPQQVAAASHDSKKKWALD